MYLLELTANKESFKTIKFNPKGLSVITGTKGNSNSKEKTYNGVGKSLMIRIIDFCLGSNPIKGFEKLEGWVFSLKIKVDEEYIISRSTNDQKKIFVDDTEIDLEDFKNIWLKEKCFIDIPKMNDLTPRALIKRFIRPTKSAYVSYLKIDQIESDYVSQLLDGFLLGLDVELMKTKYDLKKEINDINKYISHIRKLDQVKDYVSKDKKSTINLRIKNLEYEVNALNNKLNNFKIAENYSEMKKELENLNNKHNEVENSIFLINRRLEGINKSLNFSLHVYNEEIEKLYKLAKIELNSMVKKKLEDVEEFHNKLIKNRERRFLLEKEELLSERSELENQRNNIKPQINTILKYLSTHGALKEYDALNLEIREKEQALNTLKEHKDTIDTETKNKQALAARKPEESSKAIDYLTNNEKLLGEINLIFNNICKKLYPTGKSAITIENNERDNQIRFNINAEIESDNSDGINSAKIFCYDLVKLLMGRRYIKFLIHDSRLFANMDPRQIVQMLKTMNDITQKEELQYIFTINENILDSVKTEDEDFFNVIENCIVKKLYDTSDNTKLLGITIDLNYEK